QHAFLREARLLGDAARRSILRVGPQVDPLRVPLGEQPAGDELERTGHEPAAARLGSDPVPDLPHVVALRGGADRAQESTLLGERPLQLRLAPAGIAAQPAEGMFEVVRLGYEI